MPHIQDLFQTRFISARDLEKTKAAGQTFVIKNVVKEEGYNQKTQKKEDLWIVYFNNCKKGHRIRKKELPVLHRGFGVDTTEEWVGKEVTLYAVKTQVGNGVRMKPKGMQTQEASDKEGAE